LAFACFLEKTSSFFLPPACIGRWKVQRAENPPPYLSTTYICSISVLVMI
jgi:hypothetical protein